MFGYVVLHYQNIDVTKKCINSLLEIDKSAPIVIVDNCSPNKSGNELKKYYKNNNIHVLLNDKNDGFAKGNNIGFQYLKQNNNVQYIAVMNNDIIINDKHFPEVIKHFMEKNNVDVCGPDMVTIKGNHQNPLRLIPYSTHYLEYYIKINRLKYCCLKLAVFWNLYKLYKAKRPIPLREKQNTAYGCILHGSCIVYGPKYIQEERCAFIPISYMYNEEAILYDYLIYKGYKTGYCSAMTIMHMEGASTGYETTDNKQKYLFRLKNTIESIEAQIKERKKYTLNQKMPKKDERS